MVLDGPGETTYVQLAYHAPRANDPDFLLLMDMVHHPFTFESKEQAKGQMIHMQLAVEENTRLTAALLLRMHQDSRIEEEHAAYGDSGFVSETSE